MRPEDDARVLCTFDGDLSVLDLRDARVRDAIGVTIDELRGDWSDQAPNPACLRVAARARDLGAEAFIVPSAARADGWCIDVLPNGFSALRLRSRRAAVPTPG